MNDQDKTKQQLLDEVVQLRQRVAILEAGERRFRAIIAAADITQSKRAEAELAKSKAILTAAVECLPFDVFALGPDGRCILQNAVSRQYYGNALGKTAQDVCPDKRLLPRWLENNRRAFAGERVEEDVGWTVKGEPRYFHNIIIPIQEGGQVIGILGVNVDITTRMRAEEALRQSERSYRALAESTRDIIYILDRQGTLLYANQAAAQCIGINAAEIPGKRQADLFPPEMAQAHLAKIGRVFTAGEVVEEDEAFHFGPEEVWLRIYLLPLRDEAGQITAVMGVCHNITDRKRAEAALRAAHDELETRVQNRTAELTRANEELTIFRKFADAAGQGFSMADLDGRLMYLNPTLCRILGEQRPEDRIGQHLSIYYSDEANRRGKEEIEPVLRQQGHWEGELPMLTRQGTSVPTWQNSFLIRDERGNPLRLAVVITDITERKRAEEALRASEERFRVTFEEAPVGMAICVGDGVIAKANRALCRMGSYTQEELIGRHVRDFTHPDDRKLSEPFVQRLLTGEIPSFTLEKRLLRKDGQPAWTQATTAATHDPDGKIAFVLAVVEDITTRKQAQEAIKESETKLKTLFQILPVGISILDQDHHVVDVNPALGQILGITREGILRGDYTCRRYLRGDGSPMPPEEFPSARTTQEGTTVSNIEVGVVKEDGTQVWTSVSAAPLPVPGLGAAVVTMDITGHKRAQDALQQEHRTLRHLLQSSDHERQLIAYEIHDELAQQLAGAIMQFQAFSYLKDLKPADAARAFDAGVTMLEQSHFEVRRLISGVRPPILDEEGIVAAISHLVNEESRQKGRRIEYRNHVEFKRLTPILENAIYRIAQEALTNACRHSKADTVYVELLQRGDQIRIEVRDHGVGFTPEDVGESRFGLDGIRERARLLGGKATIESRPGQGTKVMAELPIVLRRPEDEPPGDI
jgi:PAS domain S-box-containing protein